MAFLPTRPGQSPTARTVQQITRWASALTRLTAGGGLAIQDGPGGPKLRDTTPARLKVKLSGAASPYDLVEVIDAPGGAHTTVSGGRTCSACAYERNATAGLNNKYVWVEADAFSKYRFLFRQTGAACSKHVFITAHGCNNLILPGASVLFNGTTLSTNSSGVATFPTPTSNGTYPVAVSKSRFVASSSTNVVVTGCNDYSTTITLLPDTTAYRCACLVDPIPLTITFVDPVYGNVTATYGPYTIGLVTHHGWLGQHATALNGFAGSGAPNYNCLGAETPIVSVMDYFMEEGSCSLSLFHPQCGATSPSDGGGLASNINFGTPDAGTLTPAPTFSFASTFNFDPGAFTGRRTHSYDQIYGLANVLFHAHE